MNPDEPPPPPAEALAADPAGVRHHAWHKPEALPHSDRPDLLGLPLPALAALLDRLGIGAHLAPRVFGAIHRKGLDLAALQTVIGAPKAAQLAAAAQLGSVALESAYLGDDGVEKLVVRYPDGALIEAVLIPTREDRVTLCLSSQVGCAMACRFCATGTLGLKRGLSAAELVAQVYLARARVAAQGRRLTHLVWMGMGEPLHHYGATQTALQVLLDVHGQPFRARNVTVSTVGLVPRIQRLADDFGGRVQLALSLHAGTDATRRRLIPMAARYDLASLKAALLAYPLPGSMALMLEYVVLPGVNDGPEDLAGVAQFCEGLRALVNLIPFNTYVGAHYQAPTAMQVERVEQQLRSLGVAVSVRWPKGRQTQGACGQLALSLEGRPAPA